MPMPPLQLAQKSDVSIMHVTAKEESPHLTTDPPPFRRAFCTAAPKHITYREVQYKTVMQDARATTTRTIRCAVAILQLAAVSVGEGGGEGGLTRG